MIHVCKEGLHILTLTILTLLPRTLAVIDEKVELKGKSQVNYMKLCLIVPLWNNIQIG